MRKLERELRREFPFAKSRPQAAITIGCGCPTGGPWSFQIRRAVGNFCGTFATTFAGR